MHKWHSVKEIPEYDNHYLVYYDSGNYSVIFFWSISWKELIEPMKNGDHITHWMKLPEAPEETHNERF